MDEQELVAIALQEADRGLDVAVSRLIEAAEAIPNPNALVLAAALLAQRKHTQTMGANVSPSLSSPRPNAGAWTSVGPRTPRELKSASRT